MIDLDPTELTLLDDHRCKSYAEKCLACGLAPRGDLHNKDVCTCKRGHLFQCGHNLPSTSEHCMKLNRATWETYVNPFALSGFAMNSLGVNEE